MRTLGRRYWFGLFSMVFGLGCTLFLVNTLRSDHGNQLWTSLGFGASTRTLNWCENRVSVMGIPALKGQLLENRGQWLWRGSVEKTLGYLDIEKWFAKYCQVPIQRVKIQDFTTPIKPWAEVQFVSGDNLTIFDLGQNRLQINEHIFKSEQLIKGLKSLKNLIEPAE